MTDNSKYKANLTIENFPSRSELLLLLDNFLKKIRYADDYVTENKDKKINILFKTKDIAHEFMQSLIFEQSKNTLYNQTTFVLSLLNTIPKDMFKPKINSRSIDRLYKGIGPSHPIKDKTSAKQKRKRTLPYVIY